MATTLQAGAVAVKLIGEDVGLMEALKRAQNGFRGFAAKVRDLW